MAASFTNIKSTFTCTKCNIEIDSKTFGKLQSGVSAVFVYDDGNKHNKYVYTSYSATLNNYYIYKLTNQVHEQIA